MNQLIAYLVPPNVHPSVLEHLRLIYNEALPMLSTKPLTFNTPEQQLAWWGHLDHGEVRCFLYSPITQPWEIVAFSLVHDRGSFYTPQFAVSEKHWGKGYGKEIIQHYLEMAFGKPLQGEQLVSNTTICRMNERAGWEIIAERGGVQYLFHPNSKDRQQEIYDEIVRYSSQ